MVDVAIKKFLDNSDLFCAFGIGLAIGCLTGLTICIALIH